MELLTQLLNKVPADASPARAGARLRAEILQEPSPRAGAAGSSPARRSWPGWATRVTGAPARNGTRRRARLALAGGLVAVALTGALVAQAVERADTPAPSSTYKTGTGARLAAWTVRRGPGGVLVVTISELRDPSGLAALLRSYGVPARLEFPGYNFIPTTSLRVIPRSCKSPNMSPRAYSELQTKILPPRWAWMHIKRTRVGPHSYIFKLPPGGFASLESFAIQPSAIPAGIGLFIEAWAAQPGQTGTQLDRNTDLVEASPQCTG